METIIVILTLTYRKTSQSTESNHLKYEGFVFSHMNTSQVISTILGQGQPDSAERQRPRFKQLSNIFVKKSKVNLATEVEGDPKAAFSIATTSSCKGGRNSYPSIAPLYP